MNKLESELKRNFKNPLCVVCDYVDQCEIRKKENCIHGEPHNHASSIFCATECGRVKHKKKRKNVTYKCTHEALINYYLKVKKVSKQTLFLYLL